MANKAEVSESNPTEQRVFRLLSEVDVALHKSDSEFRKMEGAEGGVSVDEFRRMLGEVAMQPEWESHIDKGKVIRFESGNGRGGGVAIHLLQDKVDTPTIVVVKRDGGLDLMPEWEFSVESTQDNITVRVTTSLPVTADNLYPYNGSTASLPVTSEKVE